MNQSPSEPPNYITIYTSSNKRLQQILRLLLILVLPALILLITVTIINKDSALISPLADTAQNLLGLKQDHKPNKIVMGFLPYWNFKYHPQIPYQHLTHLAIFGIAFNPDGSIQTRELDYTEPGYRAFQLENFTQIKQSAAASNTKLILVLRGFDNDTIDAIISTPTATDTFISESLAFLDLHQFDGVNLDFEYTGSPDQSTIDQFTSFVHTYSKALKSKNPQLEFSLDVFADSSTSQRIWDFPKLHPVLDQIVIMNYDFHRPSSPIAGPVAPLFGSPDNYSHDIASLLGEHLKVTPSEKIIFGVPYYGYQWRTTDDQFLSNTYPRSGSLATLKRIDELLLTHNPTLNWSSISLSPWLSFEKDDEIFQIYYENLLSLSLKYDLVNQTELAGIAIWALGYESPNSPVWSLIPQKFSLPNSISGL